MAAEVAMEVALEEMLLLDLCAEVARAIQEELATADSLIRAVALGVVREAAQEIMAEEAAKRAKRQADAATVIQAHWRGRAQRRRGLPRVRRGVVARQRAALRQNMDWLSSRLSTGGFTLNAWAAPDAAKIAPSADDTTAKKIHDELTSDAAASKLQATWRRKKAVQRMGVQREATRQIQRQIRRRQQEQRSQSGAEGQTGATGSTFPPSPADAAVADGGTSSLAPAPGPVPAADDATASHEVQPGSSAAAEVLTLTPRGQAAAAERSRRADQRAHILREVAGLAISLIEREYGQLRFANDTTLRRTLTTLLRSAVSWEEDPTVMIDGGVTSSWLITELAQREVTPLPTEKPLALRLEPPNRPETGASVPPRASLLKTTCAALAARFAARFVAILRSAKLAVLKLVEELELKGFQEVLCHPRCRKERLDPTTGFRSWSLLVEMIDEAEPEFPFLASDATLETFTRPPANKGLSAPRAERRGSLKNTLRRGSAMIQAARKMSVLQSGLRRGSLFLRKASLVGTGEAGGQGEGPKARRKQSILAKTRSSVAMLGLRRGTTFGLRGKAIFGRLSSGERNSRLSARPSTSAPARERMTASRTTESRTSESAPQPTRRVLPWVVAAAFSAIHETEEQMKPRNRHVDSTAISDHERFSTVKKRWAKRAAKAQSDQQQASLPKGSSRMRRASARRQVAKVNFDDAIYV